MAEEKKPNGKINLQERLDNIAAKKAQIEKVKALQEENYKLKQQMGQRKQGTRKSMTSKISGLQRLKDTLGKQFNSGQIDISDLM
jgi:predicted nuclease with TOPRIM domain